MGSAGIKELANKGKQEFVGLVIVIIDQLQKLNSVSKCDWK